MSEEKHVITEAEMRQLIEADRRERVNAVAVEIQASLERHNCKLSIFIEMTLDGVVRPGYKIIPK